MKHCGSRKSACIALAVTVMVLAVWRSRSLAADLPGVLPANHPLVELKLADFQPAGKAVRDVTSRIVPVDGESGFTQAIQVETAQREANEYDAQLALPLPAVALHKGDVIWMSLQARMLHSADESGQGVLSVMLEQSGPPYDKLIQQRLGVGPQWQQFACPARISKDQPAGSLHLTLRMGGAAQTLEISDPQLLRFDDSSSVQFDALPQTRLSYGGREPNAAWRATADQRIEQIRKAPLRVRVVDAAGKPVGGALVHVEMLQHAFPFGCVYAPDEIAGAAAHTPQGRAYQQHYLDLFNVGVDEHAMKWPDWENPADRALAVNALDWMTAHGVRVRGHCLVWPGWAHLPADVQSLKTDPTALAKRVDDHIRQEAGALAGRVTEWDVVNEPFVNNDLMKILGPAAMADWFKIARATDPTAGLLLNETDVPTNPPHDPHYDALFNQVQAIQGRGAPIGAIGMQSHFGSNLTSIADLQRVYDRFQTLGLPIEITELDISVTDEQLQADYLRDFLTFSFSHPEIDGIMLWGFVEGHHWRPDAALWRANWSIKPAGQAWLDLVKKRWWTDATLTSDAEGRVSMRGFLGDYRLTARTGHTMQVASINLPQRGQAIEMHMP